MTDDITKVGLFLRKADDEVLVTFSALDFPEVDHLDRFTIEENRRSIRHNADEIGALIIGSETLKPPAVILVTGRWSGFIDPTACVLPTYFAEATPCARPGLDGRDGMGLATSSTATTTPPGKRFGF